jgi:hypothetical protein
MGDEPDERPPPYSGDYPDGAYWSAADHSDSPPAPTQPEPYAPGAGDDSELVRLDLTDDERTLLLYGLIDWFGPGDGTESLAVAIGFTDLEDLSDQGERIAEAIYEGEAVSRRDWSRAMFAAEVCFASEVLGTGSEFTVIHAGTDAHWIGVLRALQRKIRASREFLGP